MAIALHATPLIPGPNVNTRIVQLTCLDADTGPTNIPHGFAAGVVPVIAIMQPLISAAAYPGWTVSINGANLVVSKLNAAGSGGGVPGTTAVMQIVCMLPHSLIA